MARQPPGRECRDLKYVRARRQNHAFISPTRDPKEFPHEVLHTEARRRGRCRRLHSSGHRLRLGRRLRPERPVRRPGQDRRSHHEPVQDRAAHGRHPQRRLPAQGCRGPHRSQARRRRNQVQRERCSAAHPCGHPGLRPLSRLQQHGRGVLHARRRHEGNPRRKRGLPHLRARDPH